jgi:hypothetical protein
MGNKTSSRDYDSQEIDNLEHDPDLHLKKVLFYGWDGSNAVALNIIIDKVGVVIG